MSTGSSQVEDAARPSPPKPKVLENPALRMLGESRNNFGTSYLISSGIPRLRAKLPGRNWLIFWGVLATFSGTIYYDRRQKRIIQQRWCNAVSHLSTEPLPSNALPRRITVYLSAPPGDTLRPVREQFQEYIRPILVAAGVDWEAIEGRKEGDVRAALAERIRRRRRKEAHESIEGDEEVIDGLRADLGVSSPDNRGGDLIIGRHTWKEYVRGLHEGWLGPRQQPQVLNEANTSDQETPIPKIEKEQLEEEGEKIPSKPSPTLPYITPKEYPQSTPTGLPSEFPISSIISNPHLIGFLKTPIRLIRFLNQRQLAEVQGREVVDLLLTSNPRCYEKHAEWEQKEILEEEEKDYHKSVREPNPEGEPDKERPWTEEIAIDDRIGSRMRKSESISINGGAIGHLMDWKGGADPMEVVGWWKWLKWAFDMDYPEPKCKGWEDGLKGDEGS